MGALHKAHGELIRVARQAAGKDGEVAVSIFVNPLQFEPGSDYKRYPRPEKADEEFCRNAGVDFLFRPSAEEVYSTDRSICRRDFIVEQARRQIATGTFSGRLHGSREVVQHSCSRCGSVRRKRFSTTGDHSPDGARPEFQHRYHCCAYSAGKRRPGVQLAQSELEFR